MLRVVDKEGHSPRMVDKLSESPFVLGYIAANVERARPGKESLLVGSTAPVDTKKKLPLRSSSTQGSSSPRKPLSGSTVLRTPESHSPWSTSAYPGDRRGLGEHVLNQQPLKNALEAAPAASGRDCESNAGPPFTVDPHEINEKVRAMLAATEALKPSSPQSRAPGSPKLSQMVPSVLSKVSNVWERISSRPSTSVGRVRGKLRKHPSQQQVACTEFTETKPSGSALADEERAPSQCARSVHRGTKSAQGKAQATVGDEAACECLAVPVALSQGYQPTDVFTDTSRCAPSPGYPKTQQVVEIGAMREDAAMTHVHDPFQTEEGFELNLEDRVLSTAPIGSSTPRGQSNTGSVESSAGDSANASSEAQVKLARVVFKLGADGATWGPARQVTLRPSESRTTVAETRPPAMGPRSRVGHIRGEIRGERVKKHPSPSKGDLEELEMALERYRPCEEPQPEDDVDEPLGLPQRIRGKRSLPWTATGW